MWYFKNIRKHTLDSIVALAMIMTQIRTMVGESYMQLMVIINEIMLITIQNDSMHTINIIFITYNIYSQKNQCMQSQLKIQFHI